MQVISADHAAELIQDNWTVIPGGFGCCGHPEAITRSIGRRFKQNGRPRNITLLFAAGSGDRAGRGIDHLAQRELVSCAIGGFWGFAPGLAALARNELIDAYCWPQGVISQLFRATAAGLPGVLSRVGLGTFIDPDQDEGRLNRRSKRGLIQKLTVNQEDFLFYPSIPVHCAIIRGTRSDERGNISMEQEISYQDALAQAQTAHNSGGIVIAQVLELVPAGTLQPQAVKVPGHLVDFVVVADRSQHPQTYAEEFNPAYVTAGPATPDHRSLPLVRRIIARRALAELTKSPGALVNLGIGTPADIGLLAQQMGLSGYTLTVESGQFGGIPASGLSFGASAHPEAVIEQSSMFDLYDGGGIDLAFLGFAQADSNGNVNVSNFAGRIPGIGGFANISRSAKRIVFCGTFTAQGLHIATAGGRLLIRHEGAIRKFVERVDEISFNGTLACQNKKSVLFVTERAVIELSENCLHLIEVAPGIDIDRDVLQQIGVHIIVGSDIPLMDSRLFSEEMA